ncbi:hypothetical protein AVEN_98201-1, partial [Araneus ventricosus]
LHLPCGKVSGSEPEGSFPKSESDEDLPCIWALNLAARHPLADVAESLEWEYWCSLRPRHLATVQNNEVCYKVVFGWLQNWKLIKRT